MLLSAYIQIFGYSPLKVQCTAILLDRMNRKNWGAEAPLAPPLVSIPLYYCHEGLESGSSVEKLQFIHRVYTYSFKPLCLDHTRT